MFGRQTRVQFRDAVNSYLLALNLEGRSKATTEYYGYILRRFARRFPKTRIHKIRSSDIYTYFAELRDTGLAQSSLNIYLLVIRRFGEWLVEQRYIKANPLHSLRAHSIPWEPVAPFSRVEINLLLKAAVSPLERCTLTLLLDTGMRATELARLRVEDIDLATGMILVHGKGGKQRRVGLNPIPALALVEYLKACPGNNGSVWPENWDRKNVARTLDGIGRRAGVAPVFPHRCRHTWTTELWRDGVDPFVLKELLGHSSLVMVERYIKWGQQEQAVQVHKQHSIIPAA